MCTGCTKCICTTQAQWSCQDVKLCDENLWDDDKQMDQDEIFDNALDILVQEVDNNKQRPPNYILSHANVPDPPKFKKDNGLLGSVKEYKNMEDLFSSISRPKRSTHGHKDPADPEVKPNKHTKRSIEKVVKGANDTVKFYETVDELNEDTLRNCNMTGTLPAKKMDMIPKVGNTRRSGNAENTSEALHIEYNQPKAYNPITDNKIDATEHETKFDASHEVLKAVLGNHSQVLKDKDLSKIVVNELKNGSEIIGDSHAPVTSNITFTPENDTLTAMAFIAGNLLNKLWNMEKDESGSSAETEDRKHQKLTDLLDLFKEPLNLRQETFLKNALQQLSSAMDKNKDFSNTSVCESIEKAKKTMFNLSNSGEGKSRLFPETPCSKGKDNKTHDQSHAAVKAIFKINNVLDLIKKFENIQGHISELKHGPILNFNKTESNKQRDVDLSEDESNSINMFGKILEKVTKLLMPKRNNKKIVKNIKSKNYFAGNDYNVKAKFKKLYNIDLANMTVTAKDKLVLDYLTHIDSSPDCLANIKNRGSKTPSVEGNLLLNLSEFFKMKSFTDLLKLIEPETKKDSRAAVVETTTKQYEETTTVLHGPIYAIKKNPKAEGDPIKFNFTKEKLKAHLKTIIEDLIDLQNAKGINVKGNIRIADALPCIYNIINAGREQPTFSKPSANVDAGKKITEILTTLRKELKSASTRRSSSNISKIKERPKSAVVWERLINNLNEKSKAKSRRMSDFKSPKSYDEIRELMDRLENSSATYKRNALLFDVPPAGKLMMLKTLDQDVAKSIGILEDIKLAYPTLSKLPRDRFMELEEFVKNVASSMHLNVEVHEKVKQEQSKNLVNEINPGNGPLKNTLKKKPILRYNDVPEHEDNLKVSRSQIVNQLIRNRMQLYLKLKDDKEFDVDNDMNYNIAKRVLYYLDAGNYDVAIQMFKVFVTEKQDKFGLALINELPLDQYIAASPTPKTMLKPAPMRRMGTVEEPLLKFEDPSKLAPQVNWVNQDHLIKQLLNIKNMGM
ncbi:unnamed protein product [Chrysodeixis includens]|uniref:Uncharacterized protein n=1 Tax=Chrysodeixis includens TaxID=689277 RepID=A0A9P0BPK7_CHRIL|nr:unnamed protein product [Chrysodeixis includens]